jgi:hypothetical protein
LPIGGGRSAALNRKRSADEPWRDLLALSGVSRTIFAVGRSEFELMSLNRKLSHYHFGEVITKLLLS